MEVICYGVSFLALLIAVVGWLRASKLKKEVSLAREEAEAVRRHVNVSMDSVKKEVLAQFRFEKRKASGEKVFHQDMTVGEALRLHPAAQQVMASFHLGGCSSCDIKEDHILGSAARDYNVDIYALLDALNGLLDGTTRVSTRQQPEVAEIKFVDNLLNMKESQ